MTSETLYALGIALMDSALSSGKPVTASSVQTAYRDGLIIAFLALIPLRRRTLGLQIGRHLVRSRAGWAVDIPANDTKSKRPFDLPFSRDLSARIDFYLKEIRSRIQVRKATTICGSTGAGP